jgi:hypothetical protein
VAKLAALELQVALFVMSVWLPSEKIPFAANAWVCPVAIEAVAGVTPIVWSRADDTVARAVPFLDPIVAVMVEVPADAPVTKPVESTVAADALELQVAWLVTSWVVPLL